MKTQKPLKVGDIVQVAEVGPIWKDICGLKGQIVEIQEGLPNADNEGFSIYKVCFLQENNPINIGDIYFQFKYKKLPKYATKHFKMKKEEENQDGN